MIVSDGTTESKSFLHRLDPRTKALILLVFLIAGASILDPIVVLVLMGVVLTLYAVAGIPMSEVADLSKPLIFAFIMFFVLNFPFARPIPGERVYFYLIPPSRLPITMTGVLSGLANGLRFVMFIWTANLITRITPTSELLLALNKSKVGPEIAIAIGIAFSYIPELQKEFSTIVEAQKSRGAQLEYRNPIRRTIAYIPIIVPALFISLLRGRDIARAIEARGFTYRPLQRTYRRDIKLGFRDYAVAGVLLVGLVTILYLRYRLKWFDYRFVYNFLTTPR